MSTDTPAADGLAEALGDVTDRTRQLIRAEAESMRRELQRKAVANLPALTFLGLSTGAALMALASSYRLSVRILERVMAPAPAAATAAAGYGRLAAAAGAVGIRRLRQAPVPFPAETLGATRDGVTNHAEQ